MIHRDDSDVKIFSEWIALAAKAYRVHAPDSLSVLKTRLYAAHMMCYMIRESSVDVLKGLKEQFTTDVLTFINKALRIFPCMLF